MPTLVHRGRREWEPLLGETVTPGERRRINKPRLAAQLAGSGRWTEKSQIPKPRRATRKRAIKPEIGIAAEDQSSEAEKEN